MDNRTYWILPEGPHGVAIYCGNGQGGRKNATVRAYQLGAIIASTNSEDMPPAGRVDCMTMAQYHGDARQPYKLAGGENERAQFGGFPHDCAGYTGLN